MCNHSKDNLILSILSQNSGEMKHLEDWMCLVNNKLPPLYRMTKGRFSQLISIFHRSGNIMLIKRRICHNTFYEFKKSDGTPRINICEEKKIKRPSNTQPML